jgi:hypothetical protein
MRTIEQPVSTITRALERRIPLEGARESSKQVSGFWSKPRKEINYEVLLHYVVVRPLFASN